MTKWQCCGRGGREGQQCCDRGGDTKCSGEGVGWQGDDAVTEVAAGWSG